MRARGSRLVAQLSTVVVLALAAALIDPTGTAVANGPPAPPQRVVATALEGFTPGSIISDDVFFAKDSMSASAIQSFLDGKVPSCDAGYTCLKDYSQSTPTRPADLMCTATYQGSARQTAAEIIYNVAQACGINPQVLLVTLQKEQGLVTHSWPSDWRYTIAMGQGCPDTAACDTRYYGFFNQVYGAAWQLKRYANPPGTSSYFTWYAPGRTWNVQYNPDASCGSSPVHIANQATANLYYYTPYQPNAAALAAGYGTGDYCSAYGNRNFYNYFTDWFGSTQTSPGSRAVTQAYESLGGAGGVLGAALRPVRCGLVDGGCYQDYSNGVIYWTAATGARVMSGDIRAVWNGLDYERGYGYPSSDTKSLGGGATYQDFQRGVIYSSTVGTFGITGWIQKLWVSMDYERGLGYPRSAQRCLTSVSCYQDFERGVVYMTPAGVHALQGEIRSVWNSLDYERGLGFPSSGVKSLASGATYQDFQRGVIYSSAFGTFAISGAVRDRWTALDYERGLGLPTGPQRCIATSECYQDFENGVIYSTPSGTHAMQGEIRSVWNSLDYERGLGYPSSGVKSLAGGASYQDFQRGVVYSSISGTFALSGPVRDKWAALDYERGLGFPTGPQTCAGAVGPCTQTFQRGSITWTQQDGAVVASR